MNGEKTNNRTIAKNTLLLYGRMFITIILGLFTSRIVLRSLGFSDYGVYNVVGGIVSMLSFLNVGMTQASHRFIAFELGRGNKDALKSVFSNSLLTHAAIAIIVLVVFETAGLWFVNKKLVIPDGRLLAANYVFQCSILTSCISIVSVPFSACVVAHEKMGLFALVSIIEAVCKCLVALGISISPFDKLFFYALGLLFIQGIVFFIYFIYCRTQFEETRCRLKYNKKVFNNMISFAGWGCVGNMGFSLKDQLSNILLNLFYGTIVNAARGIAGTVNGIINSFAMNFTMAINPQITKKYASGEIENYRRLALIGTRISFYLLSMVAIPFIVNSHYVLALWLGDVPEYTEKMVSIILLASCVYAMSHTLSTAISATGNMMWFQILLSAILLVEIPISYVILHFGGNPIRAIIPCIITTFFTLILRIVLINKYVPGFGYKEYYVNTILRGFIVFTITWFISFRFKQMFSDSFYVLMLSVIESILVLSLSIYVFGLTAKERAFVNKKIKAYILKK